MPEYRYQPGQWEVTGDMKRDFDDNGYITVRGLLNGVEVDKIKTALIDNGMVKDYGYLIPDSEGRAPIITIWKHPGNDVTGMLARCEKVVTTSEKLLGVDELYHYHGKCLLKEPHVGGQFEWHQDYGYWYVYCLKPDMMAVFIAVDECTTENGGLQVLKGSHKCGRVEHGFRAGQQGADMERVEAIKSRCDLVHTDLQPGDAVFFHANLLHYSGPNNSSKRRLAVNISFNERSNEPFKPNICPQYTKIEKVPDTALIGCTNLDDFAGKIFIKGTDDELVKSEPTTSTTKLEAWNPQPFVHYTY